MARCLRNQEVTPIYIPSIDDEAVRDYLRMVCDFKEDLRRNKQRFVHFLNRLGKKYDEGDYWTIKYRSWLKKLKLDQNIHQEVFNEYFTAVEESELKIERMTEKIEEIAAKERYNEKVAKLKCFKGIDTLTALTFVAEIGDFRRF
ncbi:MAG: hypothetical protein JXA95_12325 [Spirochaetales bacterium]|nr:hypothetical protein [Spirochaetales bacterium]